MVLGIFWKWCLMPKKDIMPDLVELKSDDNLKLKFLLAVVTVILIVLMFPKGESIESEVSVGAIWIHDDLIASFSFISYFYLLFIFKSLLV